MTTPNPNLRGIGFIALAMLIFTLQGLAVKAIGGSYSIMEIVLFRSMVALPATILLYRLEGQQGLPTTQQPQLEYARGFLLFLSYTTAFMAFAALPLAEVDAIRFSAPLMIAVLSVLILGEKVQPYRWVALMVGFVGVLFIVRPGTTSFNLGSVFALVSVFFYAIAVLMTRKLTDSGATQAYFSSLVYSLMALILNPLTFLIGASDNAHPSIAFLLRQWHTPTLSDLMVMFALGLVWAGGMYFMAQAYRSAPASVVAPFEYVSLPVNVMWGVLFFHEIPVFTTWIGTLLMIASGLYILHREQQSRT